MKVLLDNNVSKVLRSLLRGHFVIHAFGLGWQEVPDERLLPLAETHGYDVLITNDKKMHNQQNNAKRKISLVVVQNNSRKQIRAAYEQIRQAVESAIPGSYSLVNWAGRSEAK